MNHSKEKEINIHPNLACVQPFPLLSLSMALNYGPLTFHPAACWHCLLQESDVIHPYIFVAQAKVFSLHNKLLLCHRYTSWREIPSCKPKEKQGPSYGLGAFLACFSARGIGDKSLV